MHLLYQQTESSCNDVNIMEHYSITATVMFVKFLSHAILKKNFALNRLTASYGELIETQVRFGVSLDSTLFHPIYIQN